VVAIAYSGGRTAVFEIYGAASSQLPIACWEPAQMLKISFRMHTFFGVVR
jgi:hypothetical protein